MVGSWPPHPLSPARGARAAVVVRDIPDADDLEVFRDHFLEVFKPSVDWRLYHHYAFVFIDPDAPNPAAMLQAALYFEEIHNGDLVRICPSSMGAGVMVFGQPTDRDIATDGEPFLVMEYMVHFERPKETRNCFSFDHFAYATLSLEDYPLEHWTSRWRWG